MQRDATIFGQIPTTRYGWKPKDEDLAARDQGHDERKKNHRWLEIR